MLNIPDTIPACLEALSEDKRAMVNDSLCNDENSTDQEMVAHWIGNGLTDEEAQVAIAYRAEALGDPFFQLFPTPGPRP